MNGGSVDRFVEIAAELAAAFGEGVGTPWPDERFNAFALRVFAFQFAEGETYRRFCAARGLTPDRVDHWTEIPRVPTSAFKHLDLSNGPVEARFLTSGTTRGPEARGRHGVRSLALYEAACLPGLRAHLIPEGGRMRILSLIPSRHDAPSSSLSTMMDFAMAAFGDESSGGFARPEEGVDVPRFTAALTEVVDEGVPVWLAGTAFAFVQWLDAVHSGRARSVRLPFGSRVMETGGFKGRSRVVAKGRLYSDLGEAFGISLPWIVNEYGMTELLSQFYDGVVGLPSRGEPETRVHRPPPWMSTTVLDPVSLEPVPQGTPGILAHFDLANLGSVSAVLTEDRGVEAEGGGFRLGARTPGAEPRGCSLALEDLLATR